MKKIVFACLVVVSISGKGGMAYAEPASSSQFDSTNVIKVDYTRLPLVNYASSVNIQKPITVAVFHYYNLINNDQISTQRTLLNSGDTPLIQCPANGTLASIQYFIGENPGIYYKTGFACDAKTYPSCVNAGIINGQAKAVMGYTCNETFHVSPLEGDTVSPGEAYYKSLLASDWIPCKNSPFAYPTIPGGMVDPGQCSVYAKQIPAVKFVAPIPAGGPVDTAGSSSEGGVFMRDVTFYTQLLRPTQYDFMYAGTASLGSNDANNSTAVKFIQMLDSSPTPVINNSNTTYQMQMEIAGINPNVAGKSTFESKASAEWKRPSGMQNKWGTYYCDVAYTIKPDDWGKTCVVTCENWLYQQSGDSHNFHASWYAHTAYNWTHDNFFGEVPHVSCS